MEINRYQTRKPKRLAVVTMGVKLGDETRGLHALSLPVGLLARAGLRSRPHHVIVPALGQRRIATRRKHATETFPTTVVFIDEPGYTKNLDLRAFAVIAWRRRICARAFRAHGGTY